MDGHIKGLYENVKNFFLKNRSVARISKCKGQVQTSVERTEKYYCIVVLMQSARYQLLPL